MHGGARHFFAQFLLTVFYAIPGIYHPLASAPATASHPKHVVLFAALTVLCIIGALVTRPKVLAQ
jgi:hypothetical protein